jgi:Uma2 family endonuclease
VSAESIPRLFTVEEFSRIPERPGGRYELHHGEVVFVTYPKKLHKATQRRVRKMLEESFESVGVVDTEFPYRPLPEHELWGAEVAFVSQSRYDAFEHWLEGAPELVVEAKSPSNTRKEELEHKAMTALACGAIVFLLINPENLTVTAYDRTKGIQIYQQNDVVSIEVVVSA